MQLNSVSHHRKVRRYNNQACQKQAVVHDNNTPVEIPQKDMLFGLVWALSSAH